MRPTRLSAALLCLAGFAFPAHAIAVDAYSARLNGLPELQKRAIVRRAILDNGQPCKQVTAVALQGRWKNLTMWSARCTKGGDYGVFIGPDGSAQVSSCADLAKLKMSVCRLPK